MRSTTAQPTSPRREPGRKPWAATATMAVALLVGSMAGSITASTAAASTAAATSDQLIVDDTYVRSISPDTSFGDRANLVVGKGGHAYFRIDVSHVDPATLSKAVLEITKYNNAATLRATRAQETLTSGGVSTQTPWTETGMTYNNRPLDEPSSPVVTAPAPAGEAAVDLDISSLVKAARTDGKSELTVHLTTDKVDDLNVAGTDLHSTRSPNLAARPWVDITQTTDEQPVPYPISRPFTDYLSNGSCAQDVVHISDSNGLYLHTDSAGRVSLVTDTAAATPFAIYGYDYTASAYDGKGGGQQTTYAIKSLDNNRFLTIQNYAGNGRPYYTKSGSSFVLSATAPQAQWNERFQIASYPIAGQYTISSHLDSLRDGAEAATTPVQTSSAGLTAVPGDRRRHRYQFTSVNVPLLEVQQTVNDTTARLAWRPVLGDTDSAHYTVSGGLAVTTRDGSMVADVTNLPVGEKAITVSYSNAGTNVTDTVKVRRFTHPGVSVSFAQLDAMRTHVLSRHEPWYSDYQRLQNTVPNQISSPNFPVVVRTGVGRGEPAGSGNMGDYEQSAASAYYNALQWAVTSDDKYADKAVEILNAWSSTLTQIDGRDQILGAGLATLKLINAAEVIRFYDGGYRAYGAADFRAFQRLMVEVVYPVVQDAGAPMNANGNWDLAGLAAMEAIGVVADDVRIFDRATGMYQSPFVNGSIENYVTDWGQTAESARDQAHGQLGVGLMGDISTIAENQGIDLWSLGNNKLARAFNWAAQYNLFSGEGSLRAEPVANLLGRTDGFSYWTQMDQQGIYRGQLRPIYENAVAHYSKVDGVDVTWMQRAAEALRPEGFVHFDNLNFDTLTAYNGETTRAPAPLFQLRSMLTPWYQTAWGDVAKWGQISASDRTLTAGGVLPQGFTTETLPSYFAVQPDDSVKVAATQKDAPYFRLVTNTDGTYSIQEVRTGRYLGVSAQTVDGENLIVATDAAAGPAVRFQLRNWGVGRFYLVHDGRLVKIAVDGSATDPRAASLSIRLGTQRETVNTGTAVPNWFLFTYGMAEQVGPSLAAVSTSTSCVAGNVVLWVTAKNTADAVQQVTLATAFGTRPVTIPPGQVTTQRFTTMAKSISAREVTVTAAGVPFTVPYAAATCG